MSLNPVMACRARFLNPKLSDLRGYLMVAAGFPVKNRVAVESRRPRLLY
jgi:hypothetical protein